MKKGSWLALYKPGKEDTRWTPQRKRILGLVKEHTPADHCLPFSAQKPLINAISGNRKSLTRNQESSLRFVLNELNNDEIIEADITPRVISLPRPSILPVDTAELEFLPYIDRYKKFVLKRNFKKLSEDGKLHYLATSLISNDALRAPYLYWLLANIRWQSIPDYQDLNIVFDIYDSDSPMHVPAISDKSRNILECLYKYNKNPDLSKFVFVEKYKGDKSRMKTIQSRINTYHKELFLDFINQKKKEIKHFTWKQFMHIAGLEKVLTNNIEPFIITVSNLWPPTTSYRQISSVSILRSDAGQQSNKSRAKLPSAILQQREYISSAIYGLTAATKSDDLYVTESCRIISLLIKHLSEIPKQRFNTSKRAIAAHQHINNMLKKADDYAPPTSALHLALEWTKSRISLEFSQNNPILSTIKTDLSRLFTSRFLRNKESQDLASWEGSEMELEFESYVDNPKLKNATRDAIASVIDRVVRFGTQKGYMSDIAPSFLNDGAINGTRRAVVLNLHEFDQYIDALSQLDTRDHNMIAATSILGHYGGLRASEVIMLKLSDVSFDHAECYLEIQGGKTPAARRRIPLHMLAEKKHVDFIRKQYQMRKDEQTRTKRLDRIFLFGPKSSPNSYVRKDLIDYTITYLRGWFGEMLDFHSLRHSFSSWLVFRWYALKYPDVKDVLVASQHPLFSNQEQNKLRTYFTNSETREIHPSEPADLVKISQLMGHYGQETLFGCYVHIFHIIKSHALNRM